MATARSRRGNESSRRNASGLARDIEILDVLARADTPPQGLGVVRVAEVLGRDKATVSRAMATMAEAGLLTRDEETRLYRVGAKIFALAALSAESALVHEARPFLRRVAKHARETTHLSVLRGGSVLTVISELSPNEVRTASWEGRTSDPLRTPSGRVLVSDWSDSELADWYAQHANSALLVSAPPFPGYRGVEDPAQSAPAWLESIEGTRSVHDLPSLLAEAARIRKHGFATSDEEFERGVVAASAPVRDHTDKVVAAINVSAPKARVGAHLPRLGIYVAKAADQLSQRLGAPPHPAVTL